MLFKQISAGSDPWLEYPQWEGEHYFAGFLDYRDAGPDTTFGLPYM